MSDGRIIIDTEIDNSGLESGLEKAKSSAKSQAAKLAAEYKKQGMSASEAFKKAWSEIERDSDEKSKETSDNWKSNVADKLSGIAKTSIKAISGLVVGAATTLSGLAATAIKIGSDFEAQMSRVKAISGATADEFEILNELAIQLGADTAFSAKEAAEGMENLASAGFNVNEIIDAMPGMLDLAASSGEDLATSSDIAASTLRGFGLAASEAGHVADVLAKNAADTNAAVYDTGEAMKYVAPVAASLGFSLEEVTAAIGLMANAGIQGSQAGTALRASLTRLTKPTDAMITAMEKVGFNAFDSEGKMKSLSNMISELKSGMEGWTDEAKSNALATIFGTEALSGMMALINAGPEEIDALTESLINSEGASKKYAETMQDNLKGNIEALGGSLETLGIQFYQSIDTPLNDIVSSANNMVDELSNAFSEGGFEGLVSQLGNTLATIVTQISSSAPKMIELGVSLIKNLITGIQNNLPTIATGAIEIAMALVNGIIEILPMFLEVGLQALITLGQGIAEALPTLIPTIVDLMISMCDMIIENLPMILDVAIDIILALVQGLVTALPTLIQEVPRIINSFADAIYGALPQILKAGIQIILMLIKGLIQSIPTLVANIPQIIMAIVNVFTLMNWASIGKNLITSIGSGIKSMVSNIGTIAKFTAESVVNGIKGIFTSGGSIGKNLISWVANGISSSLGNLVQAAKNVAISAIQGIKNILSWDSAASIGKNLIQGLWNGISNMSGWILNLIGGFASSVISSIKGFFGIHSPSRVMRDLIGTNIVKGIGVGIDVEIPNLEKDIDANMSDIVAKMKGTVDYETAMTTARVVTYNNVLSGGVETDDISSKERPIIVEAKLIVDGKEFTQDVVAPNQDVLTEYYEGR